MSKKITSTKPVTKAEALRMLAEHMRNPNLTANELLRLINLQSKICGWNKEEEPTEETNVDKLVEAIESRRKQAPRV